MKLKSWRAATTAGPLLPVMVGLLFAAACAPPGAPAPTAAAVSTPTTSPSAIPELTRPQTTAVKSPADTAPGSSATTTSDPSANGSTGGVPPLIDASAVAALAERLEPLMAAETGCLVIEQHGSWIYDYNGTQSLAPASTQKLLLAAAALSVLGPDYRFVTSVVASAQPQAGGVSDLWLVGGGDPFLATSAYAAFADSQPRYAGMPFTSLAQLAAEVAAAGVKAVPGGLHGDDSRYDALRTVPAWPPIFEEEHDVTPLSALTVNEGYQSWTTSTIVPADPAAFAATELSQLLATDGVAAPVGADGRAPSNAVVIAQVRSAPLSQIIGAMLRSSDNQTAELLVKELGYHQSGVGSTAAGLAAELAADRKLGLPTAGVDLIDGSGLDHDNRATCSVLLDALDTSARPRLSSLIGDLAVAGQTGTLVDRFRGTPLDGTLRAKTGSIDNAGGMVGEIDLALPVRFALLLNNVANETMLYNSENAIVEAIAPYSAG